MARLSWAEPALLELEEIAEYIALDNPAAASRYVHKVFVATERLKRYPNSRKQPAELPETPYRELVVPPCRIFYRIEENMIFILHVMRSERLVRSFLLAQRANDLSP